jgi:hypothetical protein
MFGRKLDSIPFSPYHAMLVAVLALVGFVDGYDLVMTGSLLVLAGPAASGSVADQVLRSRRR